MQWAAVDSTLRSILTLSALLQLNSTPCFAMLCSSLWSGVSFNETMWSTNQYRLISVSSYPLTAGRYRRKTNLCIMLNWRVLGFLHSGEFEKWHVGELVNELSLLYSSWNSSRATPTCCYLWGASIQLLRFLHAGGAGINTSFHLPCSDWDTYERTSAEHPYARRGASALMAGVGFP